MRIKQAVTGTRGSQRGAVSLNPAGVSSVKRERKRRRRAALRGLTQRSASKIARQMAGDGGEAERLPKRPFHGEGEENSSATMNENVKNQPAKKTPGEAHGGKERRGKENSGVKLAPLTRCQTSGSPDARMEHTADVHDSQTPEDPSVFFDEDSNHIFPVEQFFGNLDVVQDYPRRTPGSKSMSRREYRRLHYYAKEDSDDEQL